MSTRQLTPYEKTHLARFGKSAQDIEKYGEMPVEYITGKVEFDGHVFSVTNYTLIPRIETEELVELTVKHAQRLSATGGKPILIADVGTGSGAIAISVADRLQRQSVPFHLIASDISERALNVAIENAETILDNSSSIEFLQSDVLAQYPDDKISVLVANLPYIPSDRVAFLDASVKDFEPHLALDGGPDGLRYIRKLIEQAKSKLAGDGVILLEVDHTHTAEFLKTHLPLEDYQLQVDVVEDQFSRTRFAVLQHR